MTYTEAQEDFLEAFPDFHKRDPVSPRKLESMLTNLCQTIEDFDITTIDSATRRAKTSRSNLFKVTVKLSEVLQTLLDQLDDN